METVASLLRYDLGQWYDVASAKEGHATRMEAALGAVETICQTFLDKLVAGMAGRCRSRICWRLTVLSYIGCPSLARFMGDS